jgi:hypothetical protein
MILPRMEQAHVRSTSVPHLWPDITPPAAKHCIYRQIAFEDPTARNRLQSRTCNRVAQTAFILFSTFLDLRPVSDASD